MTSSLRRAIPPVIGLQHYKGAAAASTAFFFLSQLTLLGISLQHSSLNISLPLHKIGFLLAAHFKDLSYGSPAIHTTTCFDCRAANGRVQLIWPELSRIRSLDSR